MDYTNNDNIMKICEWFDFNKIDYIIDDRSYYNEKKDVLYFYIKNILYVLSQNVIEMDSYNYRYENIELYIDNNNIIYEYENIIEYFIKTFSNNIIKDYII